MMRSSNKKGSPTSLLLDEVSYASFSAVQGLDLEICKNPYSCIQLWLSGAVGIRCFARFCELTEMSPFLPVPSPGFEVMPFAPSV